MDFTDLPAYLAFAATLAVVVLFLSHFVNRFSFWSKSPQKVAACIERQLRRELGAAGPIPHVIGGPATLDVTLGEFVRQGVNALGEFGSLQRFLDVEVTPEQLFTVMFDVAAPRPTKLLVSVEAAPFWGCYVGVIEYVARLAKDAGAVELEEPDASDHAKFTGDVETARRLNAEPKLLRRAGKFANTIAVVHSIRLQIPRFFAIESGAGNAVLGAHSLFAWRGFRRVLNAREFVDIAGEIEAAL